MKINFTHPHKDAVINVPPPANGKLPLKAAAYKVQIGSMFNWLMTESIVHYDNNRGRGLISDRTMNNVRYNFDPLGLRGMCCLDSDTKPRKLILADCHSSWQGAMYRYWDGACIDLNYMTTLEIHPNHELERLYRLLNSGDPHKSRDKIDNSDLAYGHLLHNELAPRLSGSSRIILGLDKKSASGKRHYHSVLGTILFALSNQSPLVDIGWRPTVVYRLRNIAKRNQNNPSGSLTTDSSKLDSLAQFCEEYCALLTLAKKTKNQIDGVVKTISSAQFFSFFVSERFTIPSRLEQDLNIVAKKMQKRIAALRPLVPILTNGTENVVEERYEKLISLLS
jgi:hypothetical protein